MKETKVYALYDSKDNILGCFTRNELKKLFNRESRSFDSIMCNINRGIRKHIYYKGDSYQVYIYKIDE